MHESGFFNTLRNASKLKEVFSRAGELGAQIEQIKTDLAHKTIEADAGAGAVRVVVNGHMEVLQVRLDRTLLVSLADSADQADQKMVEELIAAAVNAATRKVRELISQELRRATGGLNIPGLSDLIAKTEQH